MIHPYKIFIIIKHKIVLPNMYIYLQGLIKNDKYNASDKQTQKTCNRSKINFCFLLL